MKITALLTDGAIQFNLTPENDHEQKFMALLSDYTGAVSVHQGVDVGTCQGGYVRNFGRESSTVAVTIRRPEPPGGA